MSWNLEIIAGQDACLAAVAKESGMPGFVKDYVGACVDACAQVVETWTVSAKAAKEPAKFGIWVKSSGHVDSHTFVSNVEVRPIRVQ